MTHLFEIPFFGTVFPHKQTEVWGKEFPLLGRALGNNALGRSEDSSVVQRERLNHRATATEGSASPDLGSWAGPSEIPQIHARGQGFCTDTTNSPWMQAALGQGT